MSRSSAHAVCPYKELIAWCLLMPPNDRFSSRISKLSPICEIGELALEESHAGTQGLGVCEPRLEQIDRQDDNARRTVSECAVVEGRCQAAAELTM